MASSAKCSSQSAACSGEAAATGGGASSAWMVERASQTSARTCRIAVSSAQTEKASSSFSLVGVER